ncbi:MAG: hypothetical protein AB4426_10175 [Xenococcaceae cyanobacterium]
MVTSRRSLLTDQKGDRYQPPKKEIAINLPKGRISAVGGLRENDNHYLEAVGVERLALYTDLSVDFFFNYNRFNSYFFELFIINSIDDGTVGAHRRAPFLSISART